MDRDLLETKAQLLGSLLLFTKTFYKIRTGRDFLLSQPVGRESHFITASRAFTQVLRGEMPRLNFNMPPRYGKTELLIHLFAWGFAHRPEGNNLYVSYALNLAKKQTQTIKQIIELPHYRKIFGVEISQKSSAKHDFETTQGGCMYAAGSGGPVTGRGAGIRGYDGFGGLIGIDDIIKPVDATSETIRKERNDWYFNTLFSRINNFSTPIINMGQRTHEDDLSAQLIKDPEYHKLILPALDVAGNALYPEMHTKEQLLSMQEREPYVFASQYQQNPQPAGGGIFKPEWFALLEDDPHILATFITADTAETDKTYNDATVFSFWGIYKIEQYGIQTDKYALHWIDCIELRVEPKDLRNEFIQFYSNSCRYRVKPSLAAIEKKSTGVTLLSILSDIQGLQLIDIERTKISGNKTARFLEAQPFVASKRVSINAHAKHKELVIEHCRKITANNSHRFDDIADTLYDAIKIGLIDEIVLRRTLNNDMDANLKAAQVMSQFTQLKHLRSQL